MDSIKITGLTAETVIGTLAWERQIKQTVILDLELYTSIAQAGETDNLENTIDYAAVAAEVTRFVTESQYKLVEALAENIAQWLLREFPLTGLKLTLAKPGAIQNAKSVAVSIERRS